MDLTWRPLTAALPSASTRPHPLGARPGVPRYARWVPAEVHYLTILAIFFPTWVEWLGGFLAPITTLLRCWTPPSWQWVEGEEAPHPWLHLIRHIILPHGGWQGPPPLPTLDVLKDVLFWAVEIWEPVPRTYLFGRILPNPMIGEQPEECVEQDRLNYLASTLEALRHAALDCVGRVADPRRVEEVANGRVRRALTGEGRPHGAPTVKTQAKRFAHQWRDLRAWWQRERRPEQQAARRAAVREFVKAWLDMAEATSQQALLGGRS